MARIKGIMGQMVSGNLEGIVFVQRNGKTYIRKAPDRSKGNWTTKQLLHRARFTAVNDYCAGFKYSLIRQIWNRVAEGSATSGYHLFLKANMAAFGLDGTLTDSSKLRFSEGRLPAIGKVTATREGSDGQTVVIRWENDPYLTPLQLKDKLMMITRSEGKAGAPVECGATRGDGQWRYPLPASVALPADIYLYFGSPDQQVFSPDQWVQVQPD